MVLPSSRPSIHIPPLNPHPLHHIPPPPKTSNPPLLPPRKHRTQSIQSVPSPLLFSNPPISTTTTSLTNLLNPAPPKKIKSYPPLPSTRRQHPFAIHDINTAHITQTLDPTGSRTRLFARSNPDAPHLGDILLVTFTSGDPFAGLCINIRRRGPDTSILLRNRLLMTGVEMWVKIYSPKVKSIEVVQRAEKRARRARLYYFRKEKHDRGSVEGAVEEYLKRRRLLRSGDVGVRDPVKGTSNPGAGRKGVKAR
ncbi:MAG: hypothetical protein Q9182_002799 [Xanthomendoza sp. 2 TL-2023]